MNRPSNVKMHTATNVGHLVTENNVYTKTGAHFIQILSIQRNYVFEEARPVQSLNCRYIHLMIQRISVRTSAGLFYFFVCVYTPVHTGTSGNIFFSFFHLSVQLSQQLSTAGLN